MALGRKGDSDPGGETPMGASWETLHADNIVPQVHTPVGPQKPVHGPHNTS